MGGSKEKGWWTVDIGDASPGTCLVGVERGAERFSSFGRVGVFEYCFGETFFDVINAANGAARNARRERRTSG